MYVCMYVCMYTGIEYYEYCTLLPIDLISVVCSLQSLSIQEKYHKLSSLSSTVVDIYHSISVPDPGCRPTLGSYPS